MIDYLDRTKKFTNKEFNELERDSDGDVVCLSTAFVWVTDTQKETLTDDDHSRLNEYNEELSYLIADFLRNK